MNTFKTQNQLRLCHALGAMVALLVAAVGETNAATVTFDSQEHISSSGGNFNISVFDGKAAYSGNSNSGDFGDGTVEAFFLVTNSNGGTGSGTVSPLNRYADDGSTILNTPSHTNPSTSGGTFGNANVWTTNDPGTGFSGGDAANFATGTPTISGAFDVEGTIDVSGFDTGTVYIIAGTFGNDISVDLSMTGTGQPELTADNGSLTAPNGRQTYLFTYNFDNTGLLYDTITYNFLNSGANAANRGRFMGVVVNGTALIVPEPASMLLGAIGLLAVAGLAIRRRCR